jgi:MoxR-like ATPase
MSTILKRETPIQKTAAASDAARVREQMRKIRERMLKVQHRNDPAAGESEDEAPRRQVMRRAEEDAAEEAASILKLSNSVGGQPGESQSSGRTGPRVRGLYPPVPASLEDTGLPLSLIEQVLLKLLYFRTELSGRDLAREMGLPYSLIDPVVEGFKRSHVIGVRRAFGIGSITSVLALSEAGRNLARQHLDVNHYAGQLPVPLDQYTEVVRMQRQTGNWLNMELLSSAYKDMVVTPEVLSTIGPAVNSGRSLLIYGQPGNGKTFMAEALIGIQASEIYVPYAIYFQGSIIQMYDPIYHQMSEEVEVSDSILTQNSQADSFDYDRRYLRCWRPFIMTGGELTLEMLDLKFNEVSKIYDAPLQMKANNGIYLLDDFGRQRVKPHEVLNRWIIPMERRIDFLNMMNGGKLTVPFDTFLIFSSNLKPDSLGDEAFLRRIQYKMLVKNPDETEFRQIFLRYAESKQIGIGPNMLDDFLETHYRATGKPKRRCHPRDVVTHAIDLIQFEQRPMELTKDILDRAFSSCFFEHDEEETM